MSRPSASGDWQLVGESSDPVPGDPEEVAALGRELRDMADRIERQAGEIEVLASVDNWKSPTADEYREKADGVGGRLRKAFDRYDVAARALGTEVDFAGEDIPGHNYASELYRAQVKADRALSEAEDADDDLQAATRALDNLDDDVEDDDPDKTRHEGDKETAEGALTSAKALVEAAKTIRDEAASAAATLINDIIGSDDAKDSGWDKFRHVLDKVATVAGILAAVIGVVALIIGAFFTGGALLVVLGWVAFGLTAISFTNNAIKLAHGEGSWLDLSLDAIGLLTFGIGSIAAKAIKPAAQGAAATARRAFTETARRSGNVKQWMQNAGISSPSGAALGQAIRNMPPRVLPSIPMPSTLTGPMSWAPRIMDPNVRNLTNSLAAMGPDIVANPAVRAGIQNFNSQSITWAASTLTGTAAGAYSGTRTWDAFSDLVGL